MLSTPTPASASLLLQRRAAVGRRAGAPAPPAKLHRRPIERRALHQAPPPPPCIPLVQPHHLCRRKGLHCRGRKEWMLVASPRGAPLSPFRLTRVCLPPAAARGAVHGRKAAWGGLQLHLCPPPRQRLPRAQAQRRGAGLGVGGEEGGILGAEAPAAWVGTCSVRGARGTRGVTPCSAVPLPSSTCGWACAPPAATSGG